MASPATRRARPSPPIAAIVGPTGSGKTDLSLALALRQPIEILFGAAGRLGVRLIQGMPQGEHVLESRE